MHFKAQEAVLLTQGDAYVTGAGVFADVIEQFLQQTIEGKHQRFAGRGRTESIIEMADNPALGEGKLVNQVVQRLLQGKLIQHRRAKLTQQLTGGVVNASGQFVYLIGRLQRLRRFSCPFH